MSAEVKAAVSETTASLIGNGFHPSDVIIGLLELTVDLVKDNGMPVAASPALQALGILSPQAAEPEKSEGQEA